jgi:hypothetical protein
MGLFPGTVGNSIVQGGLDQGQVRHFFLGLAYLLISQGLVPILTLISGNDATLEKSFTATSTDW